jgi:hypothetical protein
VKLKFPIRDDRCPVNLKTMASRHYHGGRNDESRDDGEGRRKKTGTRRTVDYTCTNVRWFLERNCQRSARDERWMRPALNEVINVLELNAALTKMLPAVAYGNNPSTSLAIKYVHTSTNKIKHPVNVVKVLVILPQSKNSGLQKDEDY